MLELRSREQKTFFVEVDKNLRVGVFDEDARVVGLGSHVAFAVNELDERQVVFSADVRVVFTESGSNVNDTGTVCHRYIVITADEESFLVLFLGYGCRVVEEGLVFLVLEILTGHLLKDFVCCLFILL